MAGVPRLPPNAGAGLLITHPTISFVYRTAFPIIEIVIGIYFLMVFDGIIFFFGFVVSSLTVNMANVIVYDKQTAIRIRWK